MRNYPGLFLILIACLALVSCSDDNSTTNGVTSRTINVHLRADQTVTYRARFDLDGRTIVPGASSIVVAPNSVIDLSFDGLSLPRGRHTVRATILSLVPVPSQFRITASVEENGKVVVPDVPDVVASLGVMGTIEVAFTF